MPAETAEKSGLITHRESFPLGCGDKPVVEADELERRRSPLGCEKGGGELEGISGAKRMDPEQTPAVSRTASTGSMRCQCRASASRRSRASVTSRAESLFSCSRRERAEAHSMEVPHQVIVPGSLEVEIA